MNGGTLYTRHTCSSACLPLPIVYRYQYLYKRQNIGALVKVSGGMHFVANDGGGINGGAMYLASLGQLLLSQGANFTFEGNSGM